MSQTNTAEAVSEGVQALTHLAPKLEAIDAAAIIRPNADPHAAAVTALLVADFLGQPELSGKLDSVHLTTASLVDLRHLARAILEVIGTLGGTYLPEAKAVAPELLKRGEDARASLTAAVEKTLAGDADVALWLEAIRLGEGTVDLIYDLRALGELCTHRAKAGTETAIEASVIAAALEAANAIELVLCEAETAEHGAARTKLARLWTLFLPAYDLAASAGRELTRDEGRERQFPPLALVASHRRARRRPLSLAPSGPVKGSPSGPAARRSIAPTSTTSTPSGSAAGTGTQSPATSASSVAPPDPSPSALAAPAVPNFDSVVAEPAIASISGPPNPEKASEAAEAEAETAEIVASPLAASNHAADPRHGERHTIELEVGIASESNFYLGFTENISAAGVFVATYASKPIGASIEVVLTLPSGTELRLQGIVRWLREATTDSWPGMGVEFEHVSENEAVQIKKFLSLRDPLFHDDE